MRHICPGRDTRHWKPEDIFEIPCATCGTAVEFFKTDICRRCQACGARAVNPRLDPGCAAWCEKSRKCIGRE